MENISNFIGIAGVACVLLAYFLLQQQKLHANQYPFSLLNLFGALMVLYSLAYDWNLPSVVIEVAWVLVSLFGIVRIWRHRRK